MTTGDNQLYFVCMAPYEFIEHTADIAVKATGETLEQAFEAAAEGMFAIITDSVPIRPVRTITRDIESIDMEGLLVTFLSELILISETENVVLTDFKVTFTGERSLRFMAGAEPFDDDRHGRGTPVKGVSYHMMEISTPVGRKPACVRVLFDI